VPSRRVLFFGILLLIVGLLHAVPWWVLVAAPSWPVPVFVAGTVVALLSMVGLPYLMVRGHGPRHTDAVARIGDVALGAIWPLFAWSLLGELLLVALLIAGVDDPGRSRIVAFAVLAVVLVLLVWGHLEVRRVPRVKEVDVELPRLGPGLDGLRVVLLADTHFGPFDRTVWSQRVVDVVNELEPDVVCHLGDLADGSVTERSDQVQPLEKVDAALARVYITGNHEYFSDAQGWLDHMADIGWTTLHNRALVVERGGDRLVVAGVDDATAAGSGLEGHGASLETALGETEPRLPVLLLAHQPKQVAAAATVGVDLQVSGHTHGGQMWPFHYLTKVDQPAWAGLHRRGERTQLYISRGTGYWGPPFRIFAPAEISLLTLRSGRAETPQ
jgi:predicted MPP superfamily phosphohydrolase